MNTDWIKRSLILLTSTLGALAVIVTMFSKQMVSNFVDGGSEMIVKYYDIISKGGEFAGDIQVVRVLIAIDEYSHLIITASIIWMFIFLYIWAVMRNKHKENKEKRVDKFEE